MAHQPIEELDVFRLFEEVSDWSWTVVETWTPFAKKVIGEQLVTAADSVNANLVEGDGRYTIADSVRFFVIARASARETRLWIRRAAKRNLVSAEEADQKIEQLTRATKLLNLLISYRRKSAPTVRETVATYASNATALRQGHDNGDPFLDRDEE